MVRFATGTSSRLVRLRFVLVFGEAFRAHAQMRAVAVVNLPTEFCTIGNVVDAQRIQVIMCRYSSTWTERPSQTPMCVAVLRNLEGAQPSRHLLAARVAVQQFRACSQMYYEILRPPLLIA